MTISLRLPFESKKFLAAARADDVRLVTDVIEQIDVPNQSRAIVFYEQIGSGKTWLMLHLQRDVLVANDKVHSLYISFAESPSDFVAENREHFVDRSSLMPGASADALARELVEWIGKQDAIQAVSAPAADLGDKTSCLIAAIKERFQDKVLVLMLDSIFEVGDWAKLARLESALLSPIATLPHVVIIMTGRGKLYPWESPLLRLSVVTSKEFIPLRPFSLEEVSEQLGSQAPNATLSAKTVYELGGGYPWVNYLLAQGKTPAEATRIARQGLLSIIPEEIRDSVGKELEALAVLDGFRETEMAKMWEEDGWHLMGNSEVMQHRMRLMDTYLVRWRGKRFQMDVPLRWVLDNYLRTHELSRWHKLECLAYRLYEGWASDFPHRNAEFVRLAMHHVQALREEGLDPEDCPESSFRSELVRHTAHLPPSSRFDLSS